MNVRDVRLRHATPPLHLSPLHRLPFLPAAFAEQTKFTPSITFPSPSTQLLHLIFDLYWYRHPPIQTIKRTPQSTKRGPLKPKRLANSHAKSPPRRRSAYTAHIFFTTGKTKVDTRTVIPRLASPGLATPCGWHCQGMNGIEAHKWGKYTYVYWCNERFVGYRFWMPSK